jgi:hypothetical protein
MPCFPGLPSRIAHHCPPDPALLSSAASRPVFRLPSAALLEPRLSPDLARAHAPATVVASASYTMQGPTFSLPNGTLPVLPWLRVLNRQRAGLLVPITNCNHRTPKSRITVEQITGHQHLTLGLACQDRETSWVVVADLSWLRFQDTCSAAVSLLPRCGRTTISTS